MKRRTFLTKIAGSLLSGTATFASGRFYADTILGKPLRFMLGASAASPSQALHYFAYIGTYTGPRSKGIYCFDYDTRTGRFTPLGAQAEVVNPSWLETSPQYRNLYAVSEVGYRTGAEGHISSFTINRKTGALLFLNRVSSRGGGPCHLAVNHTGKALLVANYGSGSIASFSIRPSGSIGESLCFAQDRGSSVNPARQSGPHCHEVVLSPDNRFLFVPDLGLDQIKIFRFDATRGTFTPNNPPFVAVTPGYGPRHFTFGAGSRFAYLVCEMESSVMVFAYDSAKGSLAHCQTISTLPPDFAGVSNSAEIHIDRSGRFLYASNRGNDSIAVFGIDQHDGTLSTIELVSVLGKTPRNFVFDPAGSSVLVADQDSDRIIAFNLDRDSGKLTPAGMQLSVPSPVCILFIPAE